ncbi:MAG: methionyl-tRNA formyltransferase [Eggerthellaceae bacterium]|nr:methionyl-tRNA formyltransferase [Eggerthellaceae bacterium]
MRILFMGTPRFAETILEKLASEFDVVCVFTRPDAIRKRGKSLEPSEVKLCAQDLGIEVFTPKSLRDEAIISLIKRINPDIIAVAAYGCILPKEILEIPRYGCINVHASLLPAYRGAAPIERAILNGDERLGVSIMRMEEGMDTGPYCAYGAVDASDKKSAELTEELACLGADLLADVIENIQSKGFGDLVWIPQEDSKVTFAPKIAKGELNLNFGDGLALAKRKVLASSAAHPCKCIVANKTLTVTSASVCETDWEDKPVGCVLYKSKKLYLRLNDGWLCVDKVKPDGKNVMDASAFCAGLQLKDSSVESWEEIRG